MVCRPALFIYKPRRKVTLNRGVSFVTIGATLWYQDDNNVTRYTWAFDIDKKVSQNRLWDIIRYIEKQLETKIVMIVETEKGYHLYIDKYWYSVTKAYHEIRRVYKKIPELDVGHIRVSYLRHKKYNCWGIIRVSGKYENTCLRVVAECIDSVVDLCHRNYLRHIYNLLNILRHFDTETLIDTLKRLYGLRIFGLDPA